MAIALLARMAIIRAEVMVPRRPDRRPAARRVASLVVAVLLGGVLAGALDARRQHPVAHGRPPPGGVIEVTVARTTAQSWLTEPNELGARIVPAIGDGRPAGIKLYGIRPGSHIASLGFQNGDTIARVQGREIGSPDKALEVYALLRDASLIAVELTRRGDPVIILIHVV
jgi:S1-C subfamily serine protease